MEKDYKDGEGNPVAVPFWIEELCDFMEGFMNNNGLDNLQLSYKGKPIITITKKEG